MPLRRKKCTSYDPLFIFYLDLFQFYILSYCQTLILCHFHSPKSNNDLWERVLGSPPSVRRPLAWLSWECTKASREISRSLLVVYSRILWSMCGTGYIQLLFLLHWTWRAGYHCFLCTYPFFYALVSFTHPQVGSIGSSRIWCCRKPSSTTTCTDRWSFFERSGRHLHHETLQLNAQWRKVQLFALARRFPFVRCCHCCYAGHRDNSPSSRCHSSPSSGGRSCVGTILVLSASCLTFVDYDHDGGSDREQHPTPLSCFLGQSACRKACSSPDHQFKIELLHCKVAT